MATRLDRKGKRSRWELARNADSWYNTRLRHVAHQVGVIINGLAPDGVITDQSVIQRSLAAYAELLGPWAANVARYMIADVERRNKRLWKSVGAEISGALRAEISQAPTGMLYHALMDEQVALIKSLPLEAGQRIHKLTNEAMLGGKRADVVQKEIMASGSVTASRARLIARTEVARTSASFNQARAMYAGSEGYIWRTSTDADVRPTHQAMEGEYVRWDSPPKTDKGLAPYHAGCGPNCRCYAEPIFPRI